MITLARGSAQNDVSSSRWQMKFTGGEDGIQAVPRGKLFGTVDLADQFQHVCHDAANLPRGLSADLTGSSIRRSARCSRAIPRERAARDPSLGYKTDRYNSSWPSCCRPTLAGPRGIDQGDRAADRVAHRRRLADVGRGGGADGAGSVGSARLFGPVAGAFIVIAMQKLSGAGRAMGSR